MKWRKTFGVFCLLAGTVSGRNVFPDRPDWFVTRGDTNVLKYSDEVLRLDARESVSGAFVQTRDFKVDPQKNYRFEVQVRRLNGDMPFQLNLRWIDSAGEFLSEEYNLMGKLIGTEWEPYVCEAIAPARAVAARVFIVMPGGWGAEFKDFQCLEIPPVGLRVVADLYANQAVDGEWPLIVRVENRGDQTLNSAEVKIALPEGVSCQKQLIFDAGRLTYEGVFRQEIILKGLPVDPNARLVCSVGGSANGKPVEVRSETPVFITKAREIPATGQELPVPKLPPTDLQLGCYYFPVMLDWDRNQWGVRPVDYLEPLLGYYDESLPETADWHIYWAVTHGIQFFVFDWYWNQGMDFINDALEKGFLQSRFKDKMKFCIDWCAEGHAIQFKMEDLSTPSMLAFMKTLCERYFIHNNYLTVDGAPVVFLHAPTKLINAHGGWGGCRAVLDEMRALARSYGYKGVYFVAVLSNTPYLLDFQKSGFDATAPYAYGFRDVRQEKDARGIMVSYEATIPRHEESFETAQKEAHARNLDYIPAAWVGWDDYARSRYTSARTPGNTPAAFRRMLEMLPKYVEPRHKLALIESWNEWGEGGEIEPGIQYRFGRLSAVRDVLTKVRGPYDICVPTAEEVKRVSVDISMDGVYEIYEKRQAALYDFSQGLTLDFDQGRQSLYLQPVGGVRNLKMTNGLEIADLLTSDAGFISPPYLNVPATVADGVKIRMRIHAGTQARFYWILEDTPEWSEACSKHFPVKADGEFHEYTLLLKDEPGWKETVRQFRFYPSEKTGTVEIDWFKTYKER